MICQTALATLLFLSFQWMTKAQRETIQRKEVRKDGEFLVVEHYPLISIDAQVRSRISGSVVSDLTHNDFVISQNGVPQAISVWEQGHSPLSLVLMVDVLEADKNRQLIDRQLLSLKSTLARYLSAEDEASIIALADHPIVLQDFTTDKELISRAVDRISQYTRLMDRAREERISLALQEAAKYVHAAHNPKARNAIILISNTPKATADRMVLPERVVRAIVRSAAIFCWSSSADSTPDFSDVEDLPLNRVSLTALMGLTGGEAIGSEWESFFERLRERHRIAYVPFAETVNGEFVRIKLELGPNTMRDSRDLVLTYPRIAAVPNMR